MASPEVTSISNQVTPIDLRGGPRTAATSKMERFVIIVNGWKPLTNLTKRSILDVAVVPRSASGSDDYE